MIKSGKWLNRLLEVASVTVAVMVMAALSISYSMVENQEAKIYEPIDNDVQKPADCILVLGCQVHADGSMSKMLKDRMDKGIELYKLQYAPKLLLSGDHGTVYYDEVNSMRNYALSMGVPSEDIFMDHAGFSTYESMYRAKEVFSVDSCIIVSQRYHLYRALYVAKQMGIEAYGIPAKEINYAGQDKRDLREVFARDKDYAYCIFKPKPTFLGNVISIQGNGEQTLD